ncbi:Uma2 family endonuclease [Oscillatoriales cyanobacterium LEGE 11467]|uniref:Uma2 family endonuclease n=1 Tax=Zarconia navalis LEGE 11467 TaxID=1828826 RepID=A0A928W0S0_9CYAN|nr:Uma2 family endonuclease [Zarconia navalis]MBE9042392.1 Uma2 family endonuclease [Zarconia navalis LEGE 11467]
MTLPTITENSISLCAGDELILRFRTWQDYETLLSHREDKAGLRIRYNATTQEIRILSPLPRHGKEANLLADFVKALLRYEEKDWQAFTPITLKRIDRQGIEPDYCFYLENRDRILGKERIDLEIDPPPDLAIEVDLTCISSPEDYQVISPQELWIYRQEELSIYQFEEREYRESQTSRWFPKFDLKTLIPKYCDRGWKMGSSVALREFEKAIAFS